MNPFFLSTRLFARRSRQKNGRARPLFLQCSESGVGVVEVLIAVMIIAVIALLVFPASGLIRERAALTKCLHNLRTLGVSIQVYTVDHQGLLPRGDVAGPTGAYIFWPAFLAPYLNLEYPRDFSTLKLLQRTPFSCPAEKEFSGFNYAMNRELNERLYGEKAKIRLSELQAPSQYVLLSDAFHDRTIFTDLRSKMISMTRMTRRHGEIPHFLYADFHAAPFREPIYGISDAEGKTPFYRALWRARYPNE